MATIEIEIDEYLNEASDYCIFDEALRRLKTGIGTGTKAVHKRAEVLKELKSAMEDNDEPVTKWPEVKTLADMAKQEWIRENWDVFNPPSPGGPQIDCPVCKCQIFIK